MTAKQRFLHGDAERIAKALREMLKPGCESDRCLIVGSIRRRKPTVGDIEILYIPRRETRRDPTDLLGAEITVNLADEIIASLVAGGVLEKRPKKDGTLTWGEENKLARHIVTGIPVDLFAARPANWWNLVVCRTGSAESNMRICQAAIERGWKWSPYGAGFHGRATGQLAHRTTSEADVFQAVGLPHLEPHRR